MDAKPAGALIFETGVECLALETWAFGGGFRGVSGREAGGEAGGEGRLLEGVAGATELTIADLFESSDVRPGKGRLAHGLND